MTDRICTTRIQVGEPVGGSCPDCGHANILHPSQGANPALTECLVCRLEAVIAEQENRL